MPSTSTFNVNVYRLSAQTGGYRLNGTITTGKQVVDPDTNDYTLQNGESFSVNGTSYTYAGPASLNGSIIGWYGTAGTTTYLFTQNSYSSSSLRFREANGSYDRDLSNNTGTSALCFVSGTRIAVEDGWKTVEDIQIGDRIRTADGRLKAVQWVGRQSVIRRFCGTERATPVCIKAGAIAEQTPLRDLYVSPCHGIFVDGVFAVAGALVNGSSIYRVTEGLEQFTYYNIEFDTHELIVAEGLTAESYCETTPRDVYDNAEEYYTLYPDAAPVKELPYPRAKSRRQLPLALKEKLAVRAAVLAEPEAQAA